MYKFDHEFANGPKKSEPKLNEELLEKMREEFLDNVFGHFAKLDR